MEALNVSLLGRTNVPFGLSSLRPNFPYVRKSLPWGSRNRLNFLRNTPVWISSPIPRSRKLQISAQFGRSSKRRNSLRRKLVEEEKVRNAPDIFVPDSKMDNSVLVSEENENFENANDVETSFESGERDVDTNNTVEEPKIIRESVLLSKLENWVDQYKKDSEYWGVGSSPIFTVYQDKDGNVSGVSVNEDEIIRRSQIEPWTFRRDELAEEFDNVFAKISRAKFIAREVEMREYSFPENSTIAKYVVDGKRSFSLEGLHSVTLEVLRSFTLRGIQFPKLSQIGFAMLCGCFVLWAVRTVFLSRNVEVELTREEKEMLRRKTRSRIEREKMETGNVEVLGNDLEVSVGSNGRPQLDKNELMKNIVKVEMPKENLRILASSNDVSACDRDFDAKILEIREMARQAREQEQQDASQLEEHEEENDISSMLGDVKGKNWDNDSIVDIGSNVVEKSKPSDNTEIKSQFENGRSNELSTDMLDSKMNRDKDIDFPENLSGVELEKSLEGNGAVKYVSLDDPTTDGAQCLSEVLLDNKSQSNIIASKMEDLDVEKVAHSYESENTALRTSSTKEEIRPHHIALNSSSSSSSSSDASVMMKPKIIKSVKEAREYLSQRPEKLLDEELNKQEVQGRGLLLEPEAFTISNTIEPNGKTSQTIKEGSSILESPESDKLSDVSFHASVPEELSSKKEETDEEEILSLSDGTTPEGFGPSAMLDAASVQKDGTEKNQDTSDFPGTLDSAETKRSVGGKTSQRIQKRSKILESPKLGKTPDAAIQESVPEGLSPKKEDSHIDGTHSLSGGAVLSEHFEPSAALNDASAQKDGTKQNHSRRDWPGTHTYVDTNGPVVNEPPKTKQSWIETNFQEFKPVIEKIGVGFSENYMMAKEKVQEQSSLNAGTNHPGFKGDEEEFEWMKDDSLKEIVFRVRENELAGRDPFHSMPAADKEAFFKGLEKKVEKVNTKLLDLHEYVHSKVENLDYGADGISLDDPVEKIVPRWKGPPMNEDPEFLNNFVEHRKTFIGKDQGISEPVCRDNLNPGEVRSTDAVSPSSAIDKVRQVSQAGASINSKTVIEGSDGSVRAGKKSGKEHWQHTKKWSQEFLKVYNAETDLEVKSVMKIMGKDLDRWITDKEIQEAADLMTRLPKRKQKYLEKKVEKLKREMELFGPQAVASKYREYSEEKEEDYLWWLDFQFILCIELYRIEDGNQNVGFYSLEMAADLELDPKQYHVIAFEDAGDSKNFCYIIQAHMDMLGNGRAFVVARPPKDAFREAKADGFNVTVIRKGELKLNADQTLEEVEEEITEIGSKMYHDKIMHERSVDMGALIKGVVSAGKSTKKRRSRKTPKKRLSSS